MLIGNKILRFDILGSTNEYAKTIIDKAPEGIVIIAEEQRAGKGRLNKNWFSPQGGLWFSIILKPPKPNLVSIVIGIAVCDALKALGFSPKIKWPNDILIDSKKVAGILTEIENNMLIIGIGLNLNIKKFPNNFENTATSLMIEKDGKNMGKEKVLSLVLAKIEKRYQMLIDNKTGELLEVWRHYSMIIGKEVIAKMPNCQIEGKAVDIDEDGALLIKTANGSIQKIIAANCTIKDIMHNP